MFEIHTRFSFNWFWKKNSYITTAYRLPSSKLRTWTPPDCYQLHCEFQLSADKQNLVVNLSRQIAVAFSRCSTPMSNEIRWWVYTELWNRVLDNHYLATREAWELVWLSLDWEMLRQVVFLALVLEFWPRELVTMDCFRFYCETLSAIDMYSHIRDPNNQ